MYSLIFQLEYHVSVATSFKHLRQMFNIRKLFTFAMNEYAAALLKRAANLGVLCIDWYFKKECRKNFPEKQKKNNRKKCHFMSLFQFEPISWLINSLSVNEWMTRIWICAIAQIESEANFMYCFNGIESRTSSIELFVSLKRASLTTNNNHPHESGWKWLKAIETFH